MKTGFLIASALAAASVAAPATAAPFVGDTVTCEGFGFDCSTIDAVVGSGVEFGLDFFNEGTLLGADFSEGLLTIRELNNPAFSQGNQFTAGYGLQFSGVTTPFTFASLGAVNDFLGFGDSNIDLTNGVLSIDFAGVTILPGSSFSINLTENVAAVPEPTTWAMMIVGFGVVGYAMRRRKVTFSALRPA